MKLVAVNSLGNMIGLNFTMAFGVTTKILGRGIYAMTHTDDEVEFIEKHCVDWIDRETYQFPLPVFGA